MTDGAIKRELNRLVAEGFIQGWEPRVRAWDQDHTEWEWWQAYWRITPMHGEGQDMDRPALERYLAMAKEVA